MLATMMMVRDVLCSTDFQLQVFTVSLAVSVHWFLARTTRPTVLGQSAPASTTSFDPSKALRDAKVEEELQKATARSWKLACGWMLQMHVLTLGHIAYEFYQKRDWDSAGWFLSCLVIYAPWLIIYSSSQELTFQRARLSRIIIHLGCLGCALSSAGGGKDNYVIRKDLISMGQLILAAVFPDPILIFFFSLSFTAVYAWCVSVVSGPSAVNVWFFMQQWYQLVACCVVPAISVRIHRDWIEASLQSEDSDSMVSAFRRMLRSVCDGDLLLDSNLQICGDASSLQRILGTSENLTGRSFVDLVGPDDADVMKFTQFLKMSGDDGRKGAPSCLRVSLQGRTHQVAVDVCHVSLRTQFGATKHLLSMKEDTDASALLEAEPGATPSCLLSSSSSSASGTRSASGISMTSMSQLESIEVFEELSGLTLVVNASTELVDVKEAYVRFSRRTDADKMGLGMPTLKRFTRALDWHGIHTKLRQAARSSAKHSHGKPEKLPPMRIRIPGQSNAYLLAKKVTVKSMYEGQRPAGQPAYLSLQLSSFSEVPKPAELPPLEGVNEDPQEAEEVPAISSPDVSDAETPDEFPQ